MTERERLIELIDDYRHEITFCGRCDRPAEDCESCDNEQLAEHLLANGVIVPPCKIGDKVWFIYENELYQLRVQGISLTQNNSETLLHFGGYPVCVIMGNQFGKTVFLTREEAEKALEEESE